MKIEKIKAIVRPDDNFIAMKDLLLNLYDHMNTIKEKTDGMNADDYISDLIKELKNLEWIEYKKK